MFTFLLKRQNLISGASPGMLQYHQKLDSKCFQALCKLRSCLPVLCLAGNVCLKDALHGLQPQCSSYTSPPDMSGLPTSPKHLSKSVSGLENTDKFALMLAMA